MGAYPDKAVGTLRSVSLRMEEWLRQEKFGGVILPQIAQTPDGRVSEEVCSVDCGIPLLSDVCVNVPHKHT